MSEINIENMSVLDMFGLQAQTYEQAVSKFNEEGSKKYAERFQIKKDGTYTVRVLPLAPILKDGKPAPGQRTGYEYPVRQQFLKINTVDKSGKPKTMQVPVIDVRQAFPELKQDLIDLFVSVAGKKYADKEDFVKKLSESNFQGGLRYDRVRVMYVIDLADQNGGIKQFAVSYAQFRDIEKVKLENWKDLVEDNPKAPCPLSSPTAAYPLKIIRETENSKPKYTFQLATVRKPTALTEEQLKELLDMPRLPENNYAYRMRNLEATIVALRQIEDEWNVSILGEPEMVECIKAIKAALPSDDDSHFSIDGSDSGEGGTASTGDTYDDLCDAYDDMVDGGKDDRSPEGSALKGRIKEFIEKNNLDIAVRRTTTIDSLLNSIADQLDSADKKSEAEPVETPEEPEDLEESMEPEEPEDPSNDEGDESDSEPEPVEAPQPVNSRTARNDDTNEPAVRAPRERRVRHSNARR